VISDSKKKLHIWLKFIFPINGQVKLSSHIIGRNRPTHFMGQNRPNFLPYD